MHLLIALLSLTYSLCLSAQEVKQEKVYITKSGKKHHTENCHYLKYSKIETTLQEADKEGYTPCKVCHRQSSGSSPEKSLKGQTKASVTEGRCQATTQKGTQCKRKTASGSKYCWQHD